MNNILTPEEQAEIQWFWSRPLTSLSDAEFCRFVELRQKERRLKGE